MSCRCIPTVNHLQQGHQGRQRSIHDDWRKAGKCSQLAKGGGGCGLSLRVGVVLCHVRSSAGHTSELLSRYSRLGDCTTLEQQSTANGVMPAAARDTGWRIVHRGLAFALALKLLLWSYPLHVAARSSLWLCVSSVPCARPTSAEQGHDEVRRCNLDSHVVAAMHMTCGMNGAIIGANKHDSWHCPCWPVSTPDTPDPGSGA